MLGMMELVDDMRLGVAELPCEGEELARRQPLAAHDQHLRGEERVPDLAERPRDAVRFHAEAAELPHAFNLATSSHFFCRQLFKPSSASCTPFAASSRFQRKGPSPATCFRNSSHCALKALS